MHSNYAEYTQTLRSFSSVEAVCCEFINIRKQFVNGNHFSDFVETFCVYLKNSSVFFLNLKLAIIRSKMKVVIEVLIQNKLSDVIDGITDNNADPVAILH